MKTVWVVLENDYGCGCEDCGEETFAKAVFTDEIRATEWADARGYQIITPVPYYEGPIPG